MAPWGAVTRLRQDPLFNLDVIGARHRECSRTSHSKPTIRGSIRAGPSRRPPGVPLAAASLLNPGPLPNRGRVRAGRSGPTQFREPGAFGYPGKVYTVNPRLSEVVGQPNAIRISPRCKEPPAASHGARAEGGRQGGVLETGCPGRAQRATVMRARSAKARIRMIREARAGTALKALNRFASGS